MALDDCVKEILCTLSIPVLNALSNAITLVETEVNTQLTAITAQLLGLDIAVAPVNASLGLAEELLDQFRVVGTLIPVSTMEECVDMGDVVVGIDDVANRATAAVREFKQDAIRTLSYRDELVELQTTLNQFQLDLSDVRDFINQCIVENQ